MANAELYIAIARIASAFDMNLHDTMKDDIEVHHVRLVGYPKKVQGQSPGRGQVKVKMTGMVERNAEVS
jgi:hypothetical protein